ncbi:hypothetical protein, conserved [Eimeria tenella]|uniref:Uncharacterized protein n=1 Tax=Eimeria tenella TaxID=5802 RepID=U6KTR9_EIMTE|nr:hypothetical protein, conserved [Eimeria tenella]CDJ41361.1 hypothetical protein, conserved [Eimeria tenella]|eukprot:XP_013232111.1 hypothetical protein, conserved [Eimeria tenella]
MAHIFRAVRPFINPKGYNKKLVFCLATGTNSPQSNVTSVPHSRTVVSGDTAESSSSSSILPQSATFEALLKACGGPEDPVYKRLVERSTKAYNEERESVDAHLLPLLKQNRLVLFMEGTVDRPKSLASMNVVKMLTQLQSVPLMAVDVTTHPAILGFALTHAKKTRCPFLFVDGVCLGSHDTLVQLYQSGVLAKQIAGQLPQTSPYFPGELPIALY